MAACGSLHHIFENPLPENPTLLESLSSCWSHIRSMKPIEDSNFTEIFGELHFKEHHSVSDSVSSSSLFPAEAINTRSVVRSDDKDSTSFCRDFSSKNSESLLLCTEGLGFESSDDVEELDDWRVSKDWKNRGWELKRSKPSKGSIPPPISSIGRSGRPWVRFRSIREDGRFVLEEIRIPTQEFLHACREDGRLKLQFIQSDDDEISEEEEDEEDESDSEEVKDDENVTEKLTNSNTDVENR